MLKILLIVTILPRGFANSNCFFYTANSLDSARALSVKFMRS